VIVPKEPAPNDGAIEPVIDVLSFDMGSGGDYAPVHTRYTNLLYVYPLQLRYDQQRVFTRARNIVCTVRMYDTDSVPTAAVDGAPPSAPPSSLAVFYTRLHARDTQLTCAQQRCAIVHHDQCPTYADELKLDLPVVLTPRHHLLFTFSHVAVNAAMTAKLDRDVVNADTASLGVWLS
jgi:hypothetical protein